LIPILQKFIEIIKYNVETKRIREIKNYYNLLLDVIFSINPKENEESQKLKLKCVNDIFKITIDNTNYLNITFD
jgi:hypothetical protein